MAYVATNWINNTPPPLSATNLNKLTDELKTQASQESIVNSLPTWVNGTTPALTDAAPLNEMERVAALVASARGLSYTVTTWSAGWTPARNATRLNKLEQQAYLNSTADAEPLFFNGDFDTGDFSQFHDFHDAHLSNTPPGFQIVSSPRFGSSGYAARVNVDNWSDTSVYGDVAMLWDGDGSNSYELPYLQEGRTTWFRLQVAFPDGTNANFPGSMSPAAGSFAILYTWHTNPYIVPTAYSTNFRLHGGNGIKGDSGDPICLLLHTHGGAGEGLGADQRFFYHTDGAAQTQANRIPVEWNRWYDFVLRITLGRDASSGSVEWYIDGVQQTGGNCPTIAIAGDGSCPGLGHEAGFYRGPTKPGVESLYIDGMRAGPSRASVEA